MIVFLSYPKDLQNRGDKLQNLENNLTNDRRCLRQSNFELLRIIAMIIIIAAHFSVHGGFEFSSTTISFNKLWIQFIQMGGNIGVNIFVLISGYFLISQQSIKTKKVIKLWGQIFFYSIVIFIVFVSLGIESFSFIELMKNLLPITSSRWWFASTYFVLYLLVPYLNKLLCSLSQKQYTNFLILILILWCLIPTFTGQAFQSNILLWFVVLYSFSGYIKLFGIDIKLTGSQLILLSVIFTVLTFMSVVIFDIIGTKIPFFSSHATFFYRKQSLFILIISLLLFIGFSKLDLGYYQFINIISSATFGIYLIHDHVYVRSFLWETVFQNASYSESDLLMPYSLVVIAVVFVGCSLIELTRIYLIENNYVPMIDKISEFIDSKKSILSDKFSIRTQQV